MKNKINDADWRYEKTTMNKLTNKSLCLAITLLLIGAMLSGCASLGEPHYRMPEVKGRVIDMDTNKPVKGAVALAVYRAGGNSVAGPGDFAGDAQEATTDSHGEFLIPETKIYNKGDYGKLLLSHLYLLAPGYFPERILAVSEQPIKLRKIIHYFHYKKLPEFVLDVPDEHSMPSAGYKGWLNAVQSPRIAKAGSAGVFLHEPKRQFSKLFWQGGYYEEDQAIGGSFIRAFDAHKQEWLTMDCSGRTAPVARFAMENWHTMGSSPSGPPLFAGKDIILIPPDRTRQKTEGYKKVTGITPTHGNISAITGDVNQFYTIEGDGKYFCIYELKPGENVHGEDAYARKTITRGEISIFSDETASALPTIEFIATIRLHNKPYQIICTKSAQYWRIYLCQKNRNDYFFEPLLVFPAARGITAIAASGADDTIFISRENDGIRKYSAKEKSTHFGEIFVEDETFRANSGYVNYPDVVSMAVGDNGLTGSALYAVTNDDLIYRFAVDGTPDYMVKFEGGWH